MLPVALWSLITFYISLHFRYSISICLSVYQLLQNRTFMTSERLHQSQILSVSLQTPYVPR